MTEVNKVVFIVEPDLLQNVLNKLITLQYSEISDTINSLLELKSVALKEYSTFEVKVEEAKEIVQEEVKE